MQNILLTTWNLDQSGPNLTAQLYQLHKLDLMSS